MTGVESRYFLRINGHPPDKCRTDSRLPYAGKHALVGIGVLWERQGGRGAVARLRGWPSLALRSAHESYQLHRRTPRGQPRSGDWEWAILTRLRCATDWFAGWIAGSAGRFQIL